MMGTKGIRKTREKHVSYLVFRYVGNAVAAWLVGSYRCSNVHCIEKGQNSVPSRSSIVLLGLLVGSQYV